MKQFDVNFSRSENFAEASEGEEFLGTIAARLDQRLNCQQNTSAQSTCSSPSSQRLRGRKSSTRLRDKDWLAHFHPSSPFVPPPCVHEELQKMIMDNDYTHRFQEDENVTFDGEKMLAQERPTTYALERLFPQVPPTSRRHKIKKEVAVLTPRSLTGSLTFNTSQRSFHSSRSQASSLSACGSAISSPLQSHSQSFGASRMNSRSDRIKAEQTKMQGRFLLIRKKILTRFQTMKTAFDRFLHECKSSELNRKDFQAFLSRHFPGLSRDDQERIFIALDVNKNGAISLFEFHSAVEAAAPVQTLADLRRKWIALGFPSTSEALKKMTPPPPPRIFADQGEIPRMTLEKFREALGKVGITDIHEQEHIFEAITSPIGANTTTIEELTSALAAVSPALQLERARHQLMQTFGSLEKAYELVDIYGDAQIDLDRFRMEARTHFDWTTYESERVFRMIDIDGSGKVERKEFLGALQLSKPCLFNEIIRKKVRQRYKAIHEVLSNKFSGGLCKTLEAMGEKDEAVNILDAFKHTAGEHEEKEEKTPDDFQDTLDKLELTPEDITVLFKLMDIEGTGELKPLAFLRGIRLFAPSCALENLRLVCLRQHRCVADAFAHLPAEKRDTPMDKKSLKTTLEKLNLTEGVNVEAVYDLVEPRQQGGLSINELIIAVESANPGEHVRSDPVLRDEQAEIKMHWQIGPFIDNASETRANLRKPGIPQVEQPIDLPTGNTMEPTSYEEWSVERPEDPLFALKHSASEPSLPSVKFRKKSLVDMSSETPRGVRLDLWPPTERSYRIMDPSLRAYNEVKPLRHKVRGYYTNVGQKMADDMPLMRKTQSNYKQYKSYVRHTSTLSKTV